MSAMALTTAEGYARAIVAWVTPYCERVEIAGSIRRRRPQCNDVDLVVIPKTEVRPLDMFATERVNLLREFLVAYVRENPGKASWVGRVAQRVAGVALEPEVPGAEPKADAINLLVSLPKCQLDIFCASAATWATLLLCRTGSREHNIWFASRAKELGGHWNPYKGLELHGERVEASSEEDLYAAIGVDYLAPQERDQLFGEVVG